MKLKATKKRLRELIMQEPDDVECEVSASSLTGLLSTDSYEESVIEYESARNEAMDKYFNARQGLSRTAEQEKIFEGGFRMAWESR